MTIYYTYQLKYNEPRLKGTNLAGTELIVITESDCIKKLGNLNIIATKALETLLTFSKVQKVIHTVSICVFSCNKNQFCSGPLISSSSGKNIQVPENNLVLHFLS